MRNTTYKKVRISFAGAVPTEFAALPGISSYNAEGQDISFLYMGDINTIIRFINSHPLTNLAIEEPDLEEIFMHYYDKV